MKRLLVMAVGLLIVGVLATKLVYSSTEGAALSETRAITTVRHQEFPTYYAFVNDVRIAYQDFGEPQNPAVLLVMGLGGQLIHWEDSFVDSLVEQGYRVIRFDNRDAGWSSKLHEHGAPGVFTLVKYKLGISLGAPYKLDDMAQDAIGLMDHLGLQQAHVAGISMGGMIAQIMAAKFPQRVLTLTSIMSTSGDRQLPAGALQPTLEDVDGMSREQIIRSRASFAQLIDGEVAPLTELQWQQRMARSFDRAHYPDGTARQLWAIGDSGDRVELLKTIAQPTLVVHGTADNLIPTEAGEHTASLVAGSKLVLLEGMGHFIDPINEPLLIEEMLSHFRNHASAAVSRSVAF